MVTLSGFVLPEGAWSGILFPSTPLALTRDLIVLLFILKKNLIVRDNYYKSEELKVTQGNTLSGLGQLPSRVIDFQINDSFIGDETCGTPRGDHLRPCKPTL